MSVQYIFSSAGVFALAHITLISEHLRSTTDLEAPILHRRHRRCFRGQFFCPPWWHHQAPHLHLVVLRVRRCSCLEVTHRVTHRVTRYKSVSKNVKKRNHLAATESCTIIVAEYHSTVYIYIYIIIIIYHNIISSFSTVQCDCTTCLFRIFRHMRKPSSLQILQLPSHHQPSHLEVTLQYLDVHQI